MVAPVLRKCEGCGKLIQGGKKFQIIVKGYIFELTTREFCPECEKEYTEECILGKNLILALLCPENRLPPNQKQV